MTAQPQILPEPGRGTIRRMVEGSPCHTSSELSGLWDPSVTPTARHLPVPGRILSAAISLSSRAPSRLRVSQKEGSGSREAAKARSGEVAA